MREALEKLKIPRIETLMCDALETLEIPGMARIVMGGEIAFSKCYRLRNHVDTQSQVSHQCM